MAASSALASSGVKNESAQMLPRKSAGARSCSSWSSTSSTGLPGRIAAVVAAASGPPPAAARAPRSMESTVVVLGTTPRARIVSTTAMASSSRPACSQPSIIVL